MTTVLDELSADPRFARLSWEASARPLPARPVLPCALDRQVYVPPQAVPGVLNTVLRDTRHDAAVEIAQLLQDKAEARLAQRPVIRVTVAPPPGAPRQRAVSIRPVTAPSPVFRPHRRDDDTLTDMPAIPGDSGTVVLPPPPPQPGLVYGMRPRERPVPRPRRFRLLVLASVAAAAAVVLVTAVSLVW